MTIPTRVRADGCIWDGSSRTASWSSCAAVGVTAGRSQSQRSIISPHESEMVCSRACSSRSASSALLSHHDSPFSYATRASAHSWSRSARTTSMSTLPRTVTVQKRREPVASARYPASFVDPANTIARGKRSFAPAYGGRKLSSAIVMKLLSSDAVRRVVMSSTSASS